MWSRFQSSCDPSYPFACLRQLAAGSARGWERPDHSGTVLSFAPDRSDSPINGCAKPVKVTIEKGELVIRIPMQEPAPSASGKTMVVASSKGNQKTGTLLPSGNGKGKEIVVGVNAYYKA